ncbi:MAG TPA: hypothetical protein VFP87_02535 [Chitinophagaceae bacterium]|nr:hypothetical protein [Chitinophagaceae bacterium]
MIATDYIPAKEEQFQEWQQNFLSVLIASYKKWQIPTEELNYLNELQRSWNEYYAIASKAFKETRTCSQVHDKIQARKILTGAIRLFVSRWISRNPCITDQERTILRVTVRENTHKRPPVPSTKPVCLKISHIDHLQLVLDVRDERSKEFRRLPEKVKELEVWGVLGDQRTDSLITSNRQLNGYTSFNFVGGFTNHRATINFEEGSSGNSFSFRMRWLNSRKEPGPWSDVYSTFIT